MTKRTPSISLAIGLQLGSETLPLQIFTVTYLKLLLSQINIIIPKIKAH